MAGGDAGVGAEGRNVGACRPVADEWRDGADRHLLGEELLDRLRVAPDLALGGLGRAQRDEVHQRAGVDRPVELGVGADRHHAAGELAGDTQLDETLVGGEGGVVDSLELVAGLLGDVGLEVDFWKIAMRPGKPLIVGHIGRTLLLGLPGNPVAAMVTFLCIARPVILGLAGRLRHRPDLFGSEQPYFAVLEDRGRVVGAALRTPPHNLVLSELDLADVPPTSHPHDSVNVWGADEPGASLPVEEALANAPERDGDSFRVPPAGS